MELIRARLINRYPQSPSWRKKVLAMPFKQVYAIYMRMLENSDLDVQRVDTDKWFYSTVRRPIYYCPDCESSFSRDNNTLEQCEICNSERIERV